MMYNGRYFHGVHFIKEPISRETVVAIAQEDFGDMVKGVVDVQQGIMTLGGELHVDGETILMEQAGSLREHTWGINLYPDTTRSEWLEKTSLEVEPPRTQLFSVSNL